MRDDNESDTLHATIYWTTFQKLLFLLFHKNIADILNYTYLHVSPISNADVSMSLASNGMINNEH